MTLSANVVEADRRLQSVRMLRRRSVEVAAEIFAFYGIEASVIHPLHRQLVFDAYASCS
jgi:hypothetical protein